MQFRKALGLALLYLGVIVILFALLAMVLPSLENEQIQLIIASFEAPAPNAVLGFINQQFLNMIQYHNELLIAGGLLALFGILILLLHRRSQSPQRATYTAKDSVPDIKRRSRTMPLPPAPIPVSTPVNAPTADWRRLSILPPSRSDPELDEVAPFKDFSPMLASQEPPKPAPMASQAQESNPYFSYGQSAYTPPPRSGLSARSSSAAKTPDPSPYEKPAAIKEKEADELAASLKPLQSIPQEAFTPEPPPAPAFHKPAMAPVAPAQPLITSVGSLQPSAPISSAPTPATGSKRLSPAPRLDSTPEPWAPMGSKSAQKPQYLSGRIRSTVRKRAPET